MYMVSYSANGILRKYLARNFKNANYYCNCNVDLKRLLFGACEIIRNSFQRTPVVVIKCVTWHIKCYSCIFDGVCWHLIRPSISIRPQIDVFNLKLNECLQKFVKKKDSAFVCVFVCVRSTS